MKKNIPELLAPAGNAESLRAALAAGADAVYFGGTSFSNRMRAKNFGDSELRDAVRLCHDCGAKAHVTLNTRVRDNEMSDALRLVQSVLGGDTYDRADALIVADFGLAREIKKYFPHAVLHASTQTSLASPADCAVLESLGFSRLVLPREMSAEEIRALHENTSLELEMFIHGAHCVSFSGQCLLSYVMGKRSGNRGECAQPCRLPYSVRRGLQNGENKSGKNSFVKPGANGLTKTEYPLSLADMCLAEKIPEILSCGVSSLKIEGRLKSPEYVYGVTKIYRTLLDEERRASKSELNTLESLFSRGFTDGYFTGKYAKMSAVSTGNKAERISGSASENKAGKKANEKFSETGIRLNGAYSEKSVSRELSARIRAISAERDNAALKPVSAVFTARAGKNVTLELFSDGISAKVSGNIPQKAEKRGTDSNAIAKNLVKTGGTGFVISPEDIKFDIDGKYFFPLSEINALRRSAVAALAAAISEKGNCGELPEKRTVSKCASSTDTLSGNAVSQCAVSKDTLSQCAVTADGGDSKSAASLSDAAQVRKENIFSEIFYHEKTSESPLYFERGVKTAEFADAGEFIFSLRRKHPGVRRILSYFDRIYVPYAEAEKAVTAVKAFQCAESEGAFAGGGKICGSACASVEKTAEICAALPVWTSSDLEIEKLLAALCGKVSRVFCHSAGQIKTALRLGFIPDMSYRSNAVSRASAGVYRDLGAASLIMSPECPAKASAACSCGSIVYGRLPLMLLSRCIICGGKCRMGNIGGRIRCNAAPHKCRAELIDRVGASFPVIAADDCENVIYNSVPIWMADKLDPLRDRLSVMHFIFTDENTEQIVSVLEKYVSGESADGMRI